jgi:transposase
MAESTGPAHPVTVGIDVAKAHLDVAVRPGGEPWQAPNTEEGIAGLVERLKPLAPRLIVLEASGGWELAAAAALGAARLPVAVVNPRQVHDCAKAVGQLAKTDQLDARVLARFGEAVRPEPRALPDADAQALADVLARRRQLIGMQTAERQRLGTARPPVRARIEAHLAWLARELADLDDDLHRRLRASPLWREREDLLRSVPGVGPIVAVTLVADLPDLGRLGRKRIAALAGAAPLAREGGARRGKRLVWGGRGRVRAALHMAALVAVRYNPPLRAFYDRLLDAGKAKKLALTACLRKLLTILNAIVRSNTAWQPAETPAAA